MLKTIAVGIFFCLLANPLLAQKKPLDHSVYDAWESLGERAISNDGDWVIYTVVPQDGDAVLYLVKPGQAGTPIIIPRGYNAQFSDDGRFAVCRIKPYAKDVRDAKIKKKKVDEFPKDSLAVIDLSSGKISRQSSIRSYKLPQKAGGWLAYIRERSNPAKPSVPNQRTIDSLRRSLDSLRLVLKELREEKLMKDLSDADDDGNNPAGVPEPGDLVLRMLEKGKDRVFANVSEYQFNPLGTRLAIRTAKSARDPQSVNAILIFDLKKGQLDTILKGGNDIKSLAFAEDGNKLAFLAERDTAKTPVRNWGLYLWRNGDDSAVLIADQKLPGMRLGMGVSENGVVSFSRSGQRILFGVAPISSVKDTSIADIDRVKVDVWNYRDDYLQTQQLFQLNAELRRNYLAVYDVATAGMIQMGNRDFRSVVPSAEGDGEWFLATTDTGRRVAAQWTGRSKRDVYVASARTGDWKLVMKNLDGESWISPNGKYVLLYDAKGRNYYTWQGGKLVNLTGALKNAFYDELNDVPDDPSPYGVAGWLRGDSALFIYDRYDIWRFDPSGTLNPVNLTKNGRAKRLTYRNIRLDDEERFFTPDQTIYLRGLDERTKKTGIFTLDISNGRLDNMIAFQDRSLMPVAKARRAADILYTTENFSITPELHAFVRGEDKVLTHLNPQQSQYNWGTAELYHWKSFDGKPATGILYKPEDFDSSRKYPMLVYFYEKLSDGLYNYIAPAPTPSRLNISFFVSRGYLVFAPDISYTKGHPGKDAYNYIVSGAKSLAAKRWVDAKNIGIQGQSWGGYQVAYLITATDMFKAAWAGAPVVNMFSAYGGIRWESGVNRQFQYERTQSRIGSTPWERPDLYIENSPLFHLQNVKTPLVIMSNDADGAVPWYQGIEFFTAMRRLGKPVWLLNYNGEAHNLVERRNRKDIQIREQQYFDWLLKGEAPAQWISTGVPALRKGVDGGLEIQ